MADAEHGCDPRVPCGLGPDPPASVDQDDGQVGRRGPRRHVARVLLVARRVGHDEAAAWRLEAPVRHIDRDALFPLILQAVDEQREVGLRPLRPVAGRIPFDPPQLIRRDLPAVVQEPADDRALAVVDAAAENEAKGR